MNLTILLFELRQRMRQPLTYVYFLIFAFFGFMGIYRASLGRGLLARLTLAGRGNIEADAPYAIYYYITLLSTFGLLLAMAWFATAASRDFRHRSHHLFFSYPISKFGYLGGKFGGALASVLFVVSGIAVGGLVAAVSPLADPAGIGRLHVIGFIQPYVISVLPNLLLAGALFFSITLISRQFSAGWAGLIAIAALHMVAIGLARAEARSLAALLDPSGLVAARMIFEYWSIAEKNEMLMPLTGTLLMNRLVWLTVAAAILAYTWQRFSFQIPETRNTKEESAPPSPVLSPRARPSGFQAALQAAKSFSMGQQLRCMLHLIRDDFGYLTRRKSFYFVILLGLGLVLVIGYKSVGVVRGTQTFPVTSQVLEALCDNLYVLGVLIALYCSSALVWRERDTQVHEILDALPVPRWVPLLGKIGAMALVQVLMMGLVLIGGVVIQVAAGYHNFEWGLYLTELLGMQLIYYVLVSVLALFAQVLIGQRLLGFLLTFVFVDEFMVMFGLNHHLWTFASRPSYIFSDMNGYGPFKQALTAYNLYWISFSVILIVLTLLLYPRGLDTALWQRLRTMWSRLTRPRLIAGTAGIVGCLAVGGIIVYNTTVLNQFETEKYVERHLADYEKKYKSWEEVPEPHVTSIAAQVDLFPEERRVETRGDIGLVNETGAPIDTLFIQLPPDAEVAELRLGIPATQVHADLRHGVYLFVPQVPLPPGGATNLHFDLELAEHGFKDTGVNTRLVENGTFLSVVHLFPASGYDPYCIGELSENDRREKHGLPRRQRMSPADDLAERMHTPLGAHADWIDFEVVVSTSPDQITIAPGDLLREWQEDGRRFFRYRAPRKILRYAAILSGRYAVRRDNWGDIDIEIYHHPDHAYNTDLMVRSVQRSLEYFTREYSPYQFPTIRIVEFPRYQLFAEAFPGVIPLSEGYGFIAKYDEKKVKEAFRVVAHEVGHQWWAHQVIGGNVEGFFVLSEVMAQYSALMVSGREYDRSQIDAYVRHEIDRYLRGRSREVEEEVPLIRTNEETWYQHYAKGFVVMNALAEYIGEDQINGALREFIAETAFQEPPFTTSSELVECFRSVAPDSLLYLVEDCFDRIVLYDNEALAADCERIDDNRYRVTLDFQAQKLIADGEGAEQSIPLQDLVEFAVFDDQGEELCRQRRWVDDDLEEITMVVDRMPARTGIDPHYLLIDKDPDDNVIDVTMR